MTSPHSHILKLSRTNHSPFISIDLPKVQEIPGSVQGSRDKGQMYSLLYHLMASLIAQLVKNPPAMQEFSSVQFSSVAQSCPSLRDPMNRSTPGLPVHHHLPEFTQTHIHRVRDAIQPSHPGSSPFPPAPNLSQHQSLFQ